MKFHLMSVLSMGFAAAIPAPALPATYDRRQPAFRGAPQTGIIRHSELWNFVSPTATAAIVTSSAKSFPKPIAGQIKGTGICTGTCTDKSAHVHVPRATGTDSAVGMYATAPTRNNEKAVVYKFPSPTIAVAGTPIVVGHWWLQ